MHNNGDGSLSPRESCTNGCGQRNVPAVCPRPDSGAECTAEEDPKKMEPTLVVKKANREILDHERKRRVELKCMELHEMMEEQGYTQEEIRQKVGTFRQMLMEKEGVLTKEDPHGRHKIKGQSACPLRSTIKGRQLSFAVSATRAVAAAGNTLTRDAGSSKGFKPKGADDAGDPVAGDAWRPWRPVEVYYTASAYVSLPAVLLE
ncbi:serine/arginine repetitive matrix protein 3-like [Mustelus asterias]